MVTRLNVRMGFILYTSFQLKKVCILRYPEYKSTPIVPPGGTVYPPNYKYTYFPITQAWQAQQAQRGLVVSYKTIKNILV